MNNVNTSDKGHEHLGQQIGLLNFLWVLSDENRLRMVGFLSDDGRNISELAALMEQDEQSTKQQLSELRRAGLINLSTSGKQYTYSLNEVMINRFKEMVLDLETLAKAKIQPKPDDSWVDDLPIDAADRKVVKGYIYDGRLKTIPNKPKKMESILRWLAVYFEAGKIYTEHEVNAIITRYHTDYATLRRGLVEHGFLDREGGGGNYWLVS